MSRHHDKRPGNPNGFDHDPNSDRRASCRYSVDEVPAILGWYEPIEATDAPAAPAPEVEGPAQVPPPPKVFDTMTYSAIMARGPAFRGASQPPPAAKPAAGSAQLRGHAAHSPLANGKAATPAPANTRAAAAPEREPVESRPAVQTKGEPIMQHCRARILDLSQTGISLISEAIPPENQPAWVRLDGPQASDWVEGTVRGISQRDPGRFLVRLAFRDGCPYDFFKAAVYGGPTK